MKKRNFTGHVPTVYETDENLENTVIEYPNYKPRTTYVVSGPLGLKLDEEIEDRGRRFETVKDAERWVIENYGSYIERIRKAEPYRWAFRVRKGSHVNLKRGFKEDMVELEREGKVKFRVV